MQISRSFFGALAAFVLSAAATALPADASSVPAIAAFDRAFAKVDDYTVTLRAHEVLGDRTQDRVYDYWFMKPHFAKTLIVSGDGAGSGGVWAGGDQVSGHQGGLLRFIHLKVGLHDPRAVSLRGYTIPDGLIQNEVDKYAHISGALDEFAGPTLDGQPTEAVQLKPADPAADGGITRMVIYLSKTTHMPLRQQRFVGDRLVAAESWSDLKINVGLSAADFPF